MSRAFAAFATISRAGWSRLIVFIAGVLTLIVIARTYRPAQSGDLIWDDHTLVERHEDDYRPGSSLLSTFRKPLWTKSAEQAAVPYYRPTVALSYRFDNALASLHPTQGHATNLLLHLLACAFLALLARRLGAHPSACVLAALLWGLAPRLAESVAWISGRTDVLACTFGLASLLVAPNSTKKTSAISLLLLRSAFAGVLLFLSLCSKEVAIAFVGALIALTFYRQPNRRALVVPALLSIGAPLFAYGVLRVMVLGGLKLTTGGRALDLPTRTLTIFEALGRYVEMTFDAFRPRASIGYIGEIDSTRVALGIAFALFVVGAIVRWRKSIDTANATILTIGGLSLLSVLQILPLNLSGSVTADRLLYVPLAALAMFVALRISRLLERREHDALSAYAIAFAALALASIESYVTEERAGDFASDARFWVVTAEHSHPHNTMPLTALAAVARDDGEVDRACKLFEAAHRILAASPNASLVTKRRTAGNLAICLALAGRYEDAVQLMEQRVREQPNSARALMDLAFARLHVLDVDGAEDAFRRARKLDADGSLERTIQAALARFPLIRADLDAFKTDDRLLRGDILRSAHFLARVGRLPEAQAAFMAVAADPNMPEKERIDAVEFLAIHAPYDLVRRARASSSGVNLDGVVLARLAIRDSKHARVAPLLPRIDSLVLLYSSPPNASAVGN